MNILKRKRHRIFVLENKSLNIIFIFGLLRYCWCLFFLLGVYFNWQSILEKMDDKPISAFALVGQNTFTTADDIKESLLKWAN